MLSDTPIPTFPRQGGGGGTHRCPELSPIQAIPHFKEFAPLGLPVVDRTKVAGALGVGEVNVYLAQIYVADLATTVYGRFGGVNLSEGGSPHVAILGRTFLQGYTMSYEGRIGWVVLSNDSPPNQLSGPGIVAASPSSRP